MHPYRGADQPGTDLASIADLTYDPKSPAAFGRIRGGSESARRWAGDLALILHLTNDLLIGDPQRERPRSTGVGQRVSSKFGDRDHQVVDPGRRKPSTTRAQLVNCRTPARLAR